MASVGRSGEIFLSRAAAVWGFGEFIQRQLQQKSKFAQEPFVFVMRSDPECAQWPKDLISSPIPYIPSKIPLGKNLFWGGGLCRLKRLECLFYL